MAEPTCFLCCGPLRAVDMGLAVVSINEKARRDVRVCWRCRYAWETKGQLRTANHIIEKEATRG